MTNKEYPEVGDLILGTVRSVQHYGAFVELDEYPGKIGFVHIAEVATGWVKYIRDHVRERQKVVCEVIRVEPEKGHIDLSLKRVNAHQKRAKIQEWKNEQKARKLLTILAERLHMDLQKFLKAHENKLIEKYGTLYGAFEEVAINNNVLKEDGFSGPWVEEFVKLANENIVPPFVKIRAYLKLRSMAKNGVDIIKNTLKLVHKPEEGIIVKYIGAPKYMVVVTAEDFKLAEDILRKHTSEALKYIKEIGGTGELIRKG